MAQGAQHDEQVRVVIAEDNYLVSEVIKDVALSLGYLVVGEAATGVEAVALTESLRPDVVLMDLKMPDLDGLAAARLISARCPTPIVVVSAYDTPDLLQAASSAGVGAYLVKPPQAREMDRAVTVARARFADLQELRRLKADAEAAVAARDALFGLIVHDLRNPLNAISGFNQLASAILQEPASAPDLAEALSCLDQIDQSVQRLLAQIGELLDVAHMIGGKAPDTNRSLVNLGDLVRRLAAEAQQTTGRHQVVATIDHEPIVAYLDPVQIGRVLANLLTNAIRYSPAGGPVGLTVARTSWAEQPYLQLSVRDQGLGIPPDELKLIFEPFRRGSNVLHTIKGAGLGLASARQIVQQHGGSLRAESQLGRGSTFTVLLPLDKDTPGGDPAAAREEMPHGDTP